MCILQKKMAEQRNGLLLLAWATCFLLACLFAGCAGDVPDGVVYTDLHKTVRKGDSATLKCEFRGEPIAVYWKKEIGKDKWTDLITWVEGTTLPGSCLADDSCDMNQDYSLIINHVQIADRGRYMCRISNYLGILIHNYTDVTVYAPPEEPYPIIKECTSAENQPSAQRCSIRTSNTSMGITCSASSFFPELNLFFLHGSDKVINTGDNEWTNEDGTKNKFISIKGSGSDIPYVCVASDIPGSTDERTATVFLQTVSTPRAPERSSYPSQTTMASVGRIDEADGARPAKIAVPIIIIALAGGTLLIVCCWLKRRRDAPASGEGDAEEAQQMVQTIKVHVQGMVSYYELWSLAYNTPKQDMGKVYGALKKLDMETSTEEMRREHVYGVLCQWKKKTKKLSQAQIFRDALESAELGNRWHQIYEKRQQTSVSVSEGTLQQILLDLECPGKIKKFLHKLISKEETNVDSIKKKDANAPDRELKTDNAEEKSRFNFKSKFKSKSKFNKLLTDTKPNAGDEDDKIDDVLDAENNDEVSDGENKNDVVQGAMKKLKEWKTGPFKENPYVLLSLALERAGFSHVSRTIFDGTVSFFELRSLLYNMDNPDMEKLRYLIKVLGQVEDVKAGPGPQQIYEALCRWKEKHNKGDQSKIFRDALERADLWEAWLKIPETRQDIVRVSEGTVKHILLEIRDPIKIQQFIGKLVPGTVIHQNASDDKDVIQQAMETLREWNKGPFDENPMILLSRALESGGCNPVDRTFFYGTISYFELWSLVNHSNKNDIRTLCQALHALGIQDVQDTNALKRVYVQLSEWKNPNHAFDQLLALKMLLVEAGLLKLFEDLHERRNRTDTKISDNTLEHVLWHVKHPNKMYNFLLELRQNSPEPSLDDSKPARGITRAAALEELKQWSKGTFDENPIVQLSLALERAKCSPVDRTFFKVPIQLQAPIENVDIEVFFRKLTSRHCKRLANSLPEIDEKRVLEIPDENNDVLFDTMSMIRDWIANVECSNYEKRCKLDDAVIKIGRHDMTDTFKTNDYRREAEENLTLQPHPTSTLFNHDKIFDDDLISLTKLMSRLDAGIMSQFCTSVGISDQVKEAFKHRPVEEVLREWRDSNLTSKSPNGSLESIFSQITELMGVKTYVKFVTDGELEIIEKQLKAVDKKTKLLSGLHIKRDKGKWIMILKDINQKEKISVSDQQDEKKGNTDVESVSEKVPGEAGKGKDGTRKEGDGAGGEGGGAGNEEGGTKQGKDGAGKEGDGTGSEGGRGGKEGGGTRKDNNEEEIYVPNVKERGVESAFADLLKEWRNRCVGKSCRKKLKTALKTMRMEECIVNKTPSKYMYKAELVQVAFNILMSDVLPVIDALGIDQRKAMKYRRQNPDPGKGSLRLLMQHFRGTKELEAYSRREFLPILLKFGYVDAAKSLYLDYEQSLCEVSSIVSSLQEDKFQSFINELGISPDELKECSGTSEEAYRVEVMRIWKSKIRPVPYHYRMQVVTGLQTVGCLGLASEVLSGFHRGTAASDDVTRDICKRLDGEQTRDLYDLLKLKPNKEGIRSTRMVVNWVNKWMNEYDSSPNVIKAKFGDRFQKRKQKNDDLVTAGFHELAKEIMTLEFSRF